LYPYPAPPPLPAWHDIRYPIVTSGSIIPLLHRRHRQPDPLPPVPDRSGLWLRNAAAGLCLLAAAAAAVSFPPHRGRAAGAAGTHPRPPLPGSYHRPSPSTAPTTAA